MADSLLSAIGVEDKVISPHRTVPNALEVIAGIDNLFFGGGEIKDIDLPRVLAQRSAHIFEHFAQHYPVKWVIHEEHIFVRLDGIGRRVGFDDIEPGAGMGSGGVGGAVPAGNRG